MSEIPVHIAFPIDIYTNNKYYYTREGKILHIKSNGTHVGYWAFSKQGYHFIPRAMMMRITSHLMDSTLIIEHSKN